MKVLLLADIHANLTALEAVLAAAAPFDALWCLGDVIGYGPHPNECVERLQDFRHVCLAGNHDWAALGRLDLSAFNPLAREAAVWTGQQLNPASRRYLEERPWTLDREGYTLTHGSPRNPVWEYLVSVRTARESLAHFQTSVCFVGHSHVPLIFWRAEGEVRGRRLAEETVRLSELEKAILNPGSVGQPRDGDARAAFALLDTDAGLAQMRRVPYDLEATQAAIRRAGLPHALADRLSYGQ